MINVVWVYGGSAAGKETFIRRLLKDPPDNLINYLGWNDKKITAIEESLQYIGQFENDPVTEKRKQIIEKVKSIKNQPDLVVLIKGQDVDLEFDLLNKLKQEVPSAEHKIIFLHTDFELLFSRAKKKSWWSKEDEQEGLEGFKKWLVGQLEILQDLKGFEIQALDSTDQDYKPITFPPKIK